MCSIFLALLFDLKGIILRIKLIKITIILLLRVIVIFFVINSFKK